MLRIESQLLVLIYNVISKKIVLGTMMFGWKVPLIDALKITDLAIDNGIDTIDTSPSYGSGLSELVCGHLINRYSNIKISTKFSISSNIKEESFQQFLTKCCKESLRRLNKSCLDIYVLHNDENMPSINTFCESILLLKHKKMIKDFFISNTNLDTWQKIKVYEEKNGVKIIDGIQVKKNILFSDILLNAKEIKGNHKIYTYSPLCEGLLTGKYLSKKKPPINSRLSEVTRHLDYYENLLSPKITAEIKRVKSKAEIKNLSLLEYSYSKLFSLKSIDKVIIGPSKINHLKEALRCEKL